MGSVRKTIHHPVGIGGPYLRAAVLVCHTPTLIPDGGNAALNAFDSHVHVTPSAELANARGGFSHAFPLVNPPRICCAWSSKSDDVF